jgi:drug/metabolite transporter (DMT)-like permease
MKPQDWIELTLLAAIWGGSFLFTRIAAPELGPVALAGCRVIGAALFLLPLLAWQRQLAGLRAHAGRLLLIGLTNSALPFLCYSLAALALTGGVLSVFNATAPLWTMVIAWLWLGERPGKGPVLGLALGVGGVAWLVADQASFKTGSSGVSAGLGMVACLCAPLLYGFSANLTRRTMTGVPAMVQATGSQLAAGLSLLLPTWWMWPAQPLTLTAIGATAALAVVCTGVAYVLFFRLINRIGANRAVTVTFLIPVFAMTWGAAWLHEAITSSMLLACGVILLGTGLVTGALRWPLR